MSSTALLRGQVSSTSPPGRTDQSSSDAGRLTRPLAMRLGQIGTKAPLEPRVCVAVSGLQCAAANSEAAHSGAGESSLAFQGRWV